MDEQNTRPGSYRVERVVDGDTLVWAMANEFRSSASILRKTVWPNSPVERYAKEASADGRGKRVRLEYDQANALSRSQRRYGSEADDGVRISCGRDVVDRNYPAGLWPCADAVSILAPITLDAAWYR